MKPDKTKIYTKKEVQAAIPKARKLAAKRQGLPIIYTEVDIINSLYNYINGYNVPPKDKEEMMSAENLEWAKSYLNQFGHNEKNLEFVISNLYNSPRNRRNKEHIQNKSIQNKNYKPTYGYGSLGQKAWDFTLGTLDVPRKAIASFVQSILLNQDPRYYPTKILDAMDRTPTPIMGVEFAQENPVTSAAVDVVAPFAVLNTYNKAANLTENAYNYITRQPVTGFAKSNALQQIRTNSVPTNQQYEVTRTLVPRTKPIKATQYNEYSKIGGQKLTGTMSQSTGRPFSIGNTVNGSHISGQYVRIPTTKAVDNVVGWTTVPFKPFNWLGLPQLVNKQKEVIQAPYNPQYTIVETIPAQYDDSDIINALGADSGDIIHMPDGRIHKYIPAKGNSRGKQFNYGIQNEYDHHETDVTQQANIPEQQIITDQPQGTVVKVIPGRNPEYMKRDYNNYFPYIINTK